MLSDVPQKAMDLYGWDGEITDAIVSGWDGASDDFDTKQARTAYNAAKEAVRILKVA